MNPSDMGGYSCPICHDFWTESYSALVDHLEEEHKIDVSDLKPILEAK